MLASHYTPFLMFKREQRDAEEEQELDISTINVYDFSARFGVTIPSLEKNRDYKFRLYLSALSRWDSYRKAYYIYPEENYSSADNYTGSGGFGCCVNDLG